jgi:hypothetical protein
MVAQLNLLDVVVVALSQNAVLNFQEAVLEGQQKRV